MTVSGLAVAVLAASAPLLLAACSASTDATREEPVPQDPRALALDAFDEMRELESLRMAGTFTTADGVIAMDVRIRSDGQCEGEFEMGRGTARFVKDDQGAWIKGDERFWRATLDTPKEARVVIALVGSKWARPPSDAMLGPLCDFDQVLDTFDPKLFDDGSVSQGDVEVVGDVETVPVKEKSFGIWTTIWISVAEPHRVVKMITPSGDDPGRVEFSEFDRELDITPPDEDVVVDLRGDAPERVV
ncbi:hypothetical protein EXE58_07345 [Nocardioides seonyuensis]|uniref:LppX_LprAFG lipoprotein n=1 Tax=Nocardioides seonyuensis TaxID=2518371 RepID=A0A4P7IDV5_9ACTN|nr:hypothetical protein [Nocardioides seonyuensis]QBX55288.1 hypothetical protein EXE58_07345 [Nocardioides seonyuensis]